MKKNSRAKAIASSLMVATLCASGLALGSIDYSFAGDGAGGTFTIQQAADNAETVTYDVYKLFDANIPKGNTTVDNSGTVIGMLATDVELEEDVDQAISSAISAYNDKHPSEPLYLDMTGKTGSEIAAFVASNIIHSTSASAHDSFAMELARTVSEILTPVGTMDAGETKTYEDGYYLFVSESTGVAGLADASASAPIFAALGGDPITIAEKSSIPTLDKYIREDSAILPNDIYGVASGWQRTADAAMSQNIEYKLVINLPNNLDSYIRYTMMIKDTFSPGLTYDDGSVRIVIEGTQIAEGYEIDYGLAKGVDTILNINIDNLMTCLDSNGDPIPVANSSQMIIYYTAHLNESAVIAGGGNPNSASLAYSNNPMNCASGTPSMGNTSSPEVKAFTYQMALDKEDNATNEKLSGAKFAILNSDRTKALAKDGNGFAYEVSYDAEVDSDYPYVWETDEDGNITVVGVDADNYVFVEVEAPEGYADPADDNEIYLSLAATYTDTNDDHMDDAIDTVTASFDDSKSTHKYYASTREVDESGTSVIYPFMDEDNDYMVNFTVRNAKEMQLPITGQVGLVLVIAGGAVIVGSVLAMAYRRNKHASAAGGTSAK